MRLFIFALSITAVAQTNVTISGSDTGKVFDGVGSQSTAGTSRLLWDYPAQQQSDILDLLFKPNFGASLHELKVEIGANVQSIAAEPTHELTNGVINCNRGYEWWLMQQARARNASITLSGLAWGFPNWVTPFGATETTYMKDWLDCAAANSLTLNYLGVGWNENTYDVAWTKALRTALNSAGYSSVGLTADDSVRTGWDVANSANSDAAFKAALAALGEHYPGTNGAYPTATALGLGMPLWSTEDGPWAQDWSHGAQFVAHTLNLNYISGSLTRTNIWSLLYTYANINANFSHAGLMTVDSPWSGNYAPQPVLWSIAHTTQFTQPGWQYLNAACGLLSSGSTGSYVALKSTNNTDYSVIIETQGAGGNQVFNFTIANGLSTGTVHVWKSTSASQFVQQSDIVPSAGAFSLTAAADSIYSLTTTTGQAKGAPTIPAASAFPFPYSQTFEGLTAGGTAPYFADVVGAFEAASCTNGHSGTCYRQVVAATPVAWPSAGPGIPTSILGNSAWSDYTVAADAMLEQAGSVKLFGRIGSVPQTGNAISAYEFHVSNAGAWSITRGDATATLASGSLGGGFGLSTWHYLSMTFAGSTISAAVDGVRVGSAVDATYTSGLAGIGTSGYINAQFDNFSVSNGGAGGTGMASGGKLAAGRSLAAN